MMGRANPTLSPLSPARLENGRGSSPILSPRTLAGAPPSPSPSEGRREGEQGEAGARDYRMR